MMCIFMLDVVSGLKYRVSATINPIKIQLHHATSTVRSHLSKCVHTSGRCNAFMATPEESKLKVQEKELLCLGFVVFQLEMIIEFLKFTLCITF
jgi:hypothetical protein